MPGIPQTLITSDCGVTQFTAGQVEQELTVMQ
jgi:hypothetical protein